MASSKRSEVRERLRKERERELRKEKVLRLAIYTVFAGIVIALIVFIVIFGGSGNGADTKASPEDYNLGDSAATSEVVDEPYLQFGATDEAPVVDLYLDFTCPFCGEFHDSMGEELEAKALDGDVTLRVHPRVFMAQMTSTDHSNRAAIAFAAVYKDDPNAALKYMDALFDEQPSEGSDGLTNGELQALATDSGSTVNVVEAIEEGRGLDWLHDVVEPDAEKNTQGTPYILVDGKHIENWRDTNAILTAIEGS